MSIVFSKFFQLFLIYCFYHPYISEWQLIIYQITGLKSTLFLYFFTKYHQFFLSFSNLYFFTFVLYYICFILFLAAGQQKGLFMINFNSKKNKKILLSLVIVLVLAMIVPMVVSAVSAFM